MNNGNISPNPSLRWYCIPVGDHTPPLRENHRNIGFPFRAQWGRGIAQSRGVRGGKQRGWDFTCNPAPTYAGHHDHFGLGKPPPPTVSPL